MPEQLNTFGQPLSQAGGSVIPTLPTTPQPQVSKPVPYLSSQEGANVLNKNTKTLAGIEQAITIPQGATLGNLSQQYGASVQDFLKANPQITDPNKIYAGAQLNLPVKNVTGSPAANSMVEDINKAVTGGGLTASEVNGLKGLQTTQDGLLSAAASARAALDSKDYTNMDFHVNRATEQQKLFSQQLSDYFQAVAPLRQKQMDLLSPTAREQELNKQLLDIRSQADAFKLQTEQDKLAEYQGQTLGFAGGRAAELDFKATFKNQEMALKEKNLLLSLGLEQDARKMASDGTTQALSNLRDDYDLQAKVQEKITESEDLLFERADTLRQESKDTLVTMLEQLSGVDPQTLTPKLQQQLETIAARANLPFDLVQAALKTQYDRQVFEQAIDMEQATPNASQGPTSYQEWTLAGSPGTYADYLKESSTKAPTVAQQTVSTYAARMEQAIPTIDQHEKTIAGMNFATFEAQRRLPSYMQSAEYQQFDQASRNLINATLRRESGAVISEQEFDNAYKQYIPRSGDTPETLAQKKVNRNINYQSFKRAAGNAYQSVDELLSGSDADLGDLDFAL